MKIKFKNDKNPEKDYFIFNLPCTILVELQLEQHSLLSADTLKINPTLLHYLNLINLIFCHRTDTEQTIQFTSQQNVLQMKPNEPNCL